MGAMSRRSILSTPAPSPRFAWGAALLVASALCAVVVPVLWLAEMLFF